MPAINYISSSRNSQDRRESGQRVVTEISLESVPDPTPQGAMVTGGSEESSADPVMEDFVTRMAELGYVDGEDYTGETLFQYNSLETLYPEYVSDYEESTASLSIVIGECCYSDLRFWYHPDYLGSIAMVTNGDGEIHQSFLYNPWGEEMSVYEPHSTFDSPYRFNGKELDEETGLAYYGARYYDNQLSMWLSVDPLAHAYQSLSPYAFVANNPVVLVDPNGMWIEGAGFWRNVWDSDEQILAEDLAAQHEGATVTEREDGWLVEYTVDNGIGSSETGGGTIGNIEKILFSNEVERDSKGNIISTSISSGQADAIGGVVRQSSSGQLNWVGAYGELSWYLSGVSGQDYGVMYSRNVGYMTYRTDHFGLRTEAASGGVGAGLIFYSGDPSELLKTDFNGAGTDIQVNFTVVAVDVGGSIVVAPVYKGSRREFLIFVGAQGSAGASTLFASGGVTKANTSVN